MFEKEAKERARTLEGCQTLGVYDDDESYARDLGWNEGEIAGYEEGFKDGAEFGYRKANEWHYMKDVNCYEDLPQNKDVYYAYVVNVGAYDKPIIERRLGCFVEIEYDIMAYHVIAWKEIVPPKGDKRK